MWRIKHASIFVTQPLESCTIKIYFVSIGEHRRLGVHITKIKSVNLDKWPDGKVALFAESNNVLMNAYWEANMP